MSKKLNRSTFRMISQLPFRCIQINVEIRNVLSVNAIVVLFISNIYDYILFVYSLNKTYY